MATGYKIKKFTVFVRSGDEGGGGDGCSGYVLNVQGEEGGYQNWKISNKGEGFVQILATYWLHSHRMFANMIARKI